MTTSSARQWPAEMAIQWDNQATTVSLEELSFNDIHKLLVFLEQEHYGQYVPTSGPEFEPFETRLATCLHALTDDKHRKVFFRFVPRITFLGRQEFAQLYRSAFSGPILRWIVEELNLDLLDNTLPDRLSEEAREHTWYCPLTDSMPIGEFHHANHLGGVDLRPDWRSLASFGDPALVREYMANHTNSRGIAKPLRRVVILEDFVGTGTQMKRVAQGARNGALEFAATALSGVPLLFVPLVICPIGLAEANALAARHKNVAVQPILSIRDQDLIVNTTDLELQEVVKLAQQVHSQVEGDGAEFPRPYHYLGFGETGAMIVLYHNTPANTLPIIQHQSSSWKPLFPRSARIQ